VNHAKVTVEANGMIGTAKEQTFEPYASLLTGRGPRATVSMTVGRSLEYGSVKVTANVSLQCDQDEHTINRAGEMAFRKACEFMNDGFSIVEEEIREHDAKVRPGP
jgi:hypothetical protein